MTSAWVQSVDSCLGAVCHASKHQNELNFRQQLMSPLLGATFWSCCSTAGAPSPLPQPCCGHAPLRPSSIIICQLVARPTLRLGTQAATGSKQQLDAVRSPGGCQGGQSSRGRCAMRRWLIVGCSMCVLSPWQSMTETKQAREDRHDRP